MSQRRSQALLFVAAVASIVALFIALIFGGISRHDKEVADEAFHAIKVQQVYQLCTQANEGRSVSRDLLDRVASATPYDVTQLPDGALKTAVLSYQADGAALRAKDLPRLVPRDCNAERAVAELDNP